MIRKRARINQFDDPPYELAKSAAAANALERLPILGLSTLLGAVVASAVRLNLPTIQLVQAAMAPTQLVLIISYVRLGEWISRAPPEPLSAQAGTSLMAQGVGHAVVVFWSAILHAGFAWLLTTPGIVLLLYKVLTPLIRQTVERFAFKPA